MFVIEKAINDYRDRVDRWERARDKWIADDPSEYGYRSERDYESKHPRPGSRVRAIGGVIMPVFLVMMVAGTIATVVVSNSREAKKNPKPEAAKVEGKNCRDFNMNDHVRVQYGDYENTTGIIVGGCEGTQSYQVKFDGNQKKNVPNDGESGDVDVGGRIIGVDSSDNLVVIEEPKKE